MVQAQIRSALSFQTAVTGTPMQTFGVVVGTLPPGVVFDWGSHVSDDGSLTPVRFLHFEPTRIVSDVAAPSRQIDAVYARVREVLGSIRLSLGAPILGEPSHVADYSELLPRFSFTLDVLLKPEVVGLLRDRVPTDLLGTSFVPGFVFQGVPNDREYQGAVGSDQYVLQLRAGTKLSDGAVFSAAPLTTEEHAVYLGQLEELVTKLRNLRKRAR